jgi:site-specific recombinase XerD
MPLKIKEVDGYFHVTGTVKTIRGSTRVRRSLGLAATASNREQAEQDAKDIESQIRRQIASGREPCPYVSVAAARYLKKTRKRPLGKTSIDIIKEVVGKFGLRKLDQIREHEWSDWIDERQADNKAETRERFINAVLALLNWCARRPRQWIAEAPLIDRDQSARNPATRSRRPIEQVSPELVALMLNHASPHLRAQLAVEWSTGARVSSVLYGCSVGDLDMTPGRESIRFRDTKSGHDVVSVLHPFAVSVLRDYLEWRGGTHDKSAPLFVTHLRAPYKDNAKNYGGQNKTAFNAMKRRAAAAIMAQAEREIADLAAAGKVDQVEAAIGVARARAELVGRITQHWFRHMLATQMLQSGDLRTVMAQGGWNDPRSALGYTHDIEDHRRSIVSGLSAPVATEPESEERSA